MGPRAQVAAVVMALTILVTACSDDKDAGGDPDAPELSGSPIKLMVIADGGAADAVDRVGRAATIAASAVNADGGVQGSPVEIEACDSGVGDLNLAAACAREAVDAGSAAVVGSFTTTGDSYVPVLEEAEVPVVAPFAISFAEFQNPISYPIVGGAPSTTAGLGAQLADNGSTAINVSFIDVEQGALAATLLQEGLTPRGLDVDSETPIPPETADLSPAISAAEDQGPDGIALVISEAEASRYIRQADELGVDTTLAVSSAAINPDDVESLGTAGEGVLVTSNFVPISQTDNPGVQQLLDERDEYDSDLKIDDSAINAWAGVHIIADVLADASGDVTQSETLLNALSTADDVDLAILPPLDFTAEPDPVFGGVITRLYNRDVVYAEIRDGAIVPQGDVVFVDPFASP